jgi:hypothetical protein
MISGFSTPQLEPKFCTVYLSFYFSLQLSPAEGEEDPVAVPTPDQRQAFTKAVGRFHLSPVSPSSSAIPRQLSFQEELLERCRERGLTPDRPALFGIRPVTNPRVSEQTSFVYSSVGSSPIYVTR